MTSAIFCTSQTPSALNNIDDDPMLLHRQNSGIGDTYSVIRSAGSHVTGYGNASTPMANRYHDEPEVDYDDGPTDLYRKIENKDWDAALARLEVAPDEAKVWVSRKELHSHKIRWRLLPLHATCIFRSPLALIESLIEAYRDGPQMKDDQGMLPIHLACRNGASKGVVLTLLQAFPESIRVRDRKGRFPLDLVEASSSQNKEAVILAMKRFEKEEKAGNLRLPIATAGHTRSELSQLHNGSNNNNINNNNNMNASANSSVSNNNNAMGTNEVDYEHRTVLFRLLLKKDWKAASSRANAFPDEAATWIVTKGFNGNLRFLPLHKACVLQPPEALIETLVAAYIDGAKARDQDGWLPLHCACFYGASDKVVSTLLVAHPKGAQSKDDEGRLPLHYACLKGAPSSVVDALLAAFPKGAMSKDDEGRLPIHHACSKGAPEGVIDALLKASPKGAQSKDDQGRLPLHHACRKGAVSERTIRTLLRVYPRAAQIKDDQDKLAIHYACQNGLGASIVQILLTTFPESIHVKNGFGYTPLAEARALETPKTAALIEVLERFQAQQDAIKAESSGGDHANGGGGGGGGGINPELEKTILALQQRVTGLEQVLEKVAILGKELRHNIKTKKDKVEWSLLMEKFAEKLGEVTLGNGGGNSSTIVGTIPSMGGGGGGNATYPAFVPDVATNPTLEHDPTALTDYNASTITSVPESAAALQHQQLQHAAALAAQQQQQQQQQQSSPPEAAAAAAAKKRNMTPLKGLFGSPKQHNNNNNMTANNNTNNHGTTTNQQQNGSRKK